MLELAVQLVVLALAVGVVAFIVHHALAPRYQFMVHIHGDAVTLVKGKVAADYLAQVREVCREQAVTTGWIGGVKRGKSIALRFSSNIPPNCQQRLRNIWFTS